MPHLRAAPWRTKTRKVSEPPKWMLNDAETDQGKWFQEIHCLFFSSVSWKNCPTTCGLRKFSYGAHIVNQNPSNPKFLCVLFPSLHWICSVCFKWLSADFDRLIQKKKRRNDYAWLPKRVVSKNWSQLSCGTLHFESIWHVSFGMFLPSDPKRKTHWPRGGPQLLEQSKATVTWMSRFSGAYCRGFASVAFFAMSCSCGHLLNSRILETPDPPTTRFTVAFSLTPFFVYPNDFTAYHCLLNSKGNILDHIKNAE